MASYKVRYAVVSATCSVCGKEVNGRSRKHADGLLAQHHMNAHPSQEILQLKQAIMKQNLA